jgi:hypothetical protein
VLSEGALRRSEVAVELSRQNDTILRLERAAASAREAETTAESRARQAVADLAAERRSAADRIAALQDQIATSLAERKRLADALAETEARMAAVRSEASRAEQDIAILRAESLWRKTQAGPATETGGEAPMRPAMADAAPDVASSEVQPKRPQRTKVRREARIPMASTGTSEFGLPPSLP